MCNIVHLVIVISVFSCGVYCTVLDDTKCSKFDYEYRVLERVIFLENKNAEMTKSQMILDRKNEELGEIVKEQRLEMERLNKEQNDARKILQNYTENSDRELWSTQADFKERLSKVKGEIEKQGETVRKMNETHTVDKHGIKASIQNLESELTTTQTDFEERLTKAEDQIEKQGETVRKMNETHAVKRLEIKASLQNLQSDLQQMDENLSSRVSFSARLAESKKYANGETIIFKKALNNDGNAYNPATGVFTAPVKGKFWFSITILVYFRIKAHVFLMKNNTEIGRVVPDAQNNGNYNRFDQGSVSTVVNLQKGDTVYVRMHSGSQHTFTNIYGTAESWFSGFRISEY